MNLRPLLLLGLLWMAPAAADTPAAPPWSELQPLPSKPPAASSTPTDAAPCQPANFIPGETASQRVTLQGTPPALYQLASGEQMNINGWLQENERVVKLPTPYALTYYQFGCMSDFSYVLDVSRAGKRHGLYQHVLGFEAHPSKPRLFLHQAERKNDRYQRFTGVVDLDTKRKTPLPALSCVAGAQALFSGERLFTYGEAHKGRDSWTDVCVWDLDGKPKARLGVDLDWMAASRMTLLDRIGVLPHEPDTFYVLHYDRFAPSGHCELRLRSLSRAERSRKIDLGASGSREACLGHAEQLGTFRLAGN